MANFELVMHAMRMRINFIWTLFGLACAPALWAQNSGLHWLHNAGQWDVPARMRAEWAGGVTWLEDDGMNMWVAGEG